MNATARTTHTMDIVTLEMASAIEEWKSLPDGTIHVLLRLPVRCLSCKTEHAWFINREGRTKCAECDAAAEQAKAKEAMAVKA